MRARTVFLAAGLAFSTACPPLNDCSFWMRCDGGSVEQCGEGIDQQIGRRVISTPCPPLNPVCVQDGEAAGCFVGADPCDAGVSWCDGGVVLACSILGSDYVPYLVPLPQPYWRAEDCTAPIHFVDGGSYTRVCVSTGAGASCRQ